jgi:hypothetical protein
LAFFDPATPGAGIEAIGGRPLGGGLVASWADAPASARPFGVAIFDDGFPPPPLHASTSIAKAALASTPEKSLLDDATGFGMGLPR